MRDCEYMPIHIKNGGGIEHVKDLANETWKVLAAGGIYMRH
jgi:hypothetical protein